MDIKAKYNLWQNSTIAIYNQNTQLVMNDISHRLMIQKKVSKESLAIHKSLLTCEHPNLVRIHDIADNGNGGIILEQFIDGVTLEYYLKNEHSDPAERENIILQICDGLIALHERNIVHRDLTPFNIMITDDGTVKIIDFDIARIPRQDADRDTILMGTEGFAAPEQFGFYQSTARTDIYALGNIINYVYMGELYSVKPYKNNKRLTAIIDKCTQIDPNQRFSDVSEVKDEFLKIIGRENERKSLKEIGFGGLLDLVLADLPGFRLRSRMPKFIAAILYFIVISFVVSLFATYSKSFYHIFLCVTVVICGIVIPFFCFSDYLSIQKKLIRRLSPVSRRRLFILIGWISLFAGIILCGSIPDL